MSKTKDNDQSLSEQAGDQNSVLTIEEHKENFDVDEAVFQVVILYKVWASGKKVSRAVFQNAVETFLKAPMRGE